MRLGLSQLPLFLGISQELCLTLHCCAFAKSLEFNPEEQVQICKACKPRCQQEFGDVLYVAGACQGYSHNLLTSGNTHSSACLHALMHAQGHRLSKKGASVAKGHTAKAAGYCLGPCSRSRGTDWPRGSGSATATHRPALPRVTEGGSLSP